jgi:hypothetical protein
VNTVTPTAMRALSLAVVTLLCSESRAAASETGSPKAAAVDESRDRLVTVHGAAVTLGLGAMDYTSDSARALMTHAVGVYADLRVAYGTRSRFGVEAAFVRSQRHLVAGRLRDDPASLFGQNFEALLRVNLPMHTGEFLHAPFAVAGVGFTDFMPPDDRDPMTRARRIDRAGIVPLGLGCALSFRGVYGEVRLMYRPTFAVGSLDATAGPSPSMEAWFAGLAGGIEF